MTDMRPLNQRGMTKREFLQATAKGGLLGLGIGVLRMFNFNISFNPSSSADVAAAASTPNSLSNPNTAQNKLAVSETVLPDNWPNNPDSARIAFSPDSHKEDWRKDIYMGDDKQIHWDGTWVMEAKPLKTDYAQDGMYVDKNGKPLTEADIYRSDKGVRYVNVNFGAFGPSWQDYGTGWNGKEATYYVGYGNAGFEVEQAVIYAPPSGCTPADLTQQAARDRAGTLLNAFIGTDRNFSSGKIAAQVWSEETGKFIRIVATR